MNDINALSFRRGTIKGQLTKFSNAVNNFSKDDDLIQLMVKKEKIEEGWTEFQNIQSTIEQKSINPENEELYRDEFENLYYTAVAGYIRLVEKYKKVEGPSSVQVSNEIENNAGQSVSSARSSVSNQASIVKLAALNVPNFSGDYKQWSTFNDMFTALIHSNEALTDIQKFFYLKSALSGDAEKVIQSYETSAKNYIVAWNCLNERFNNKKIIVQTHTKAIFDLEPVTKEKSSKLRQFMDLLSGHMTALKSLGYDPKNWGPMLLHIISTKLDGATLKEWETQAPKKEVPEVDDLLTFLQNRFQILEAVEGAQNINLADTQNKQKYNKVEKAKKTISHTSTNKFKCYFCNEGHPIYRYNKCKFKGCKKCGKLHNNLLHEQNDITPVPPSCTVTTHAAQSADVHVLLSTAIIRIYDKFNKPVLARALLDSGSQSNFITKELSNKLGLAHKSINCEITGVNKSKSYSTHSVLTKIQSRSAENQYMLNFLTVPKITTFLPTEKINTSNWDIPQHIQFADPSYAQPGKIDILLGAEIFYDVLRTGQYKPIINGPMFQETAFGWIVAGPAKSENNCTVHSFFLNVTPARPSCFDLNDKITKFWELEEVPKEIVYSSEEKMCVDHFNKSVKRNGEGRFVVRLPLRENINTLGASRSIALKRFLSLENRFRSNPKLKQKYVEFMEEYANLGHMERVNPGEKEEKSYYIPHHAVLRDSSATTKLRVVFDASCATDSGKSLNDLLLKGPNIQDELICIIARFRSYKYVMSSDIEKMYRQIWVSNTDANLQRILWRSKPDEPITEFKLKTITYGTTPASYLATGCLMKLAEEMQELFPVAHKAITNDFYMDDYLGGANDITAAEKLRDDVINILNTAGFKLRKWIANDHRLLENISNEDNDPLRVLNLDDSTIKTLGLFWNPSDDVYQYKVDDNCKNNTERITKRIVLSMIATIFDPLGLVGPVVVVAKIFMQKLWLARINWDDLVSTELNEEWQNYQQTLPELEEIHIPRWIIGCSNVLVTQIHGFADASTRAFGACLYTRTTDELGNHYSRLIVAKSKVAPLKVVSLARLELCAAVLLARLADKIIPRLNITIHEKRFWSDSTIVLAWINSPSTRWKTFVAHRVGEIQTLTAAAEWGYVKSSDNPADIISRGCSPKLLKDNTLWWEGPVWFKSNENEWPKSSIDELSLNTELPEIKRKPVALHSSTKEEFYLLKKYSNLSKLFRVTAYCKRWFERARNKKVNFTDIKLDVTEIAAARLTIIKLVQQHYFFEEIKLIKSKMYIKTTKIALLRPFLDEQDVLRVGGRINKSTTIHFDQRNPILLPAKSEFTVALFRNEHERLLHAGPQALLSAIREKFWPLNGRNIARRTVHQCVICFRSKPVTYEPIMGDLPRDRIEPERAFKICGVDFAGPIMIKTSLRRNAPMTKAYICVFVCFVTKAIHVELVGDLTTNAFLSALRRFWSRRGICNTIYSDNGTNFVGANRQLKELRDLFLSKQHMELVHKTVTEVGVKWQFIPPRAPHFGGLWEAAVKSVKYHLIRHLGNAFFTYEELNTVLVRIEACLNSRPLTPMSSDPSDLNVLTPGHFLIGGSLTDLPEPDLLNITPNLLRRWQRTIQVTQQIWSRWSTEYLSQLQGRSKWCKSKGPPLKPDTLVLIKEDNLPPLQWAIGRVTEVYPGKDGVIRVALIRTNKGEVKRAARSLCPLPIKDDN
ncbi:uncharacterized protein LOC114131043 [Aphis gossypii]|uniref:uncharacterized protein LOC114131043 n=1 Tax=Aphis gossypii TaxID=80765 RepID=UPI0021593B18|nr:uncharacterized protein LOC114131043 [Aphis gossypii]